LGARAEQIRLGLHLFPAPCPSGGRARQRSLRAVTRAGLPRIRLHDARHTAVSLLLATGLDRYSVARHAGHTVATMESTYAHVLPKQAQAVADTMTRLLDPLNARTGP